MVTKEVKRAWREIKYMCEKHFSDEDGDLARDIALIDEVLNRNPKSDPCSDERIT